MSNSSGAIHLVEPRTAPFPVVVLNVCVAMSMREIPKSHSNGSPDEEIRKLSYSNMRDA